jgi:hypothetical protein
MHQNSTTLKLEKEMILFVLDRGKQVYHQQIVSPQCFIPKKFSLCTTRYISLWKVNLLGRLFQDNFSCVMMTDKLSNERQRDVIGRYLW